MTATRICFVCLGNICRSPTAHGVMDRLVADAGLAAAVAIDSAGTAAYHAGELPDERSRAAARRRGFELNHRARQFTAADLDRFDLVIAMDRDNLRRLHQLAGGRAAPAIALLRSFDPTAEAGAEVPDPWAGGDAGFEQVLDQCERACAGLLAHVQERMR
ncbi:MAG TPA: low molecular weight protein-tyrosine-phosphatase [Kofleriaceae bacterium]|nr:low molecular weight protein-tyrosine-phosphatase [Kofleriaceae bacterium]HMG56071.1 low molecular weight protein-tyrosine-phosphatase [Kofleriaceae bacterium]